MNIEEVWKDIPEYENVYQISNLGNIRRWLKNPRDNNPRWKTINAKTDKDGYKFYVFSLNSYEKIWKIHRLVLFLFNPIDNIELYQVNHKDLNKSNNYVDNLEWSTAKENSLHKVKELGLFGENGTNSKLSEEQVLSIRDLYSQGLTQTKIASMFNITQSYVSEIIKEKKWKHLLVQSKN